MKGIANSEFSERRLPQIRNSQFEIRNCLMTTLCFDVSSGGVSAALFNSKLELLKLHEVHWELETDEAGQATLSLDAITARLKQVLPDLSVTEPLDAVCIGAFMHNCVLLDAGNKPLTSVFTWLDRRGDAGLEYVRSRAGGAFHQRTGCHFHPMFPVFKLATLAAGGNSLLDRAKRIVSIKAFLIHRLTGVWIEDHGTASATGLYNIGEGDWDKELLELIHLDRETLPPVAGRDDVAGRVTREAAAEFGLPEGTRVVNGSGDGFLAHLGSDCESPARISVSLGTSAAARRTVPQPALDPNSGTFCYKAGAGAYMLGCASSNGGNVLDWGRSIFGVATEAGFSEDLPIFIPLLHGERSPEWNPRLTGSWHRLRPHHTPGDLSRSVFEGVIFNLAYLVEILRAATGAGAPDMVLSGNGFLQPLAAPLFAAVAGIPVSMPSAPGLASLRGAGICASRAIGLPVPLLETRLVSPLTDSRIPERYAEYKRIRGVIKCPTQV